MTRNPCRNCEKPYIDRNGNLLSSYKCGRCEKLIAHKKYLMSKRKYAAGETITTLGELMNQKFVIWYGRTMHIEAIKSLQFRVVLNSLDGGDFRYAVERNGEKNKTED